MARIIAVTACPTGIAHTYMAAEALKKTAALMGHSIRVETQGAAGAKDILDEADLAAAELVILAADTHVEMTRFAGKAVHETSTSVAIRDPRGSSSRPWPDRHPRRAPAEHGRHRRSPPRPKRPPQWRRQRSWPSPPARPASRTPSWPPKR
jgi:PTS system fructose-specific IIC component